MKVRIGHIDYPVVLEPEDRIKNGEDARDVWKVMI